jgi:hypothetical protein
MEIVTWELLHPRMTAGHLGYLIGWLSPGDPDDAVTQIHKNYMHGGGWFDYNGFKMEPGGVLVEKNPPLPESEDPPDPPLRPLAKTMIRDETVYFYQYSWVAVAKPDGSFRVARID